MRKVCRGKITNAASERVRAPTKQNMREIELENQSQRYYMSQNQIPKELQS